uniref:Uncharacterized protein n=1 Tax=Meloidogyne enterolobii TaxID=390850 RepID=A0A6V7UGK4_MELEN|nr:unnamed protein product [Meloidogyne enterolobii]
MFKFLIDPTRNPTRDPKPGLFFDPKPETRPEENFENPTRNPTRLFSRPETSLILTFQMLIIIPTLTRF